MIRVTCSVPREIFWAQSAHSSKSRAVGDEGTLSPIVAITSAVTATIVAGSLSAVRLAVDMPKYFLDQAAVATSYGIFPANLWRAGHSKRFCSSLLLHVVIRNFSRTFLVFTFEHFDSHYVALRNRRDLGLRGGGLESVPVVLVVEDEEPLQEIVRDALKEGGFDLTMVASGREAVAMIESGVVKYSALVADVNLKGSMKG